MNKLQAVEQKYLKKEIPQFSVGDTVKVLVRIAEGEKGRLQAFEGQVIARKGAGTRESFTVRRISYGEGVERTFPLHARTVERVEVVRAGKAKRAKLYYLRKKIGKESKIEERKEGEIESPAPVEGQVEETPSAS